MRSVCSLGMLLGLLATLSGCGDTPQKAPDIGGGGGLGIGKGSAPPPKAKDPSDERKSGAELLEKVLKAHGGLDNLKKFKKIHIEAEGWTIAQDPGKTNCTRDSVYSYPDKTRHRWVMDTRPDKLIVLAALNGGTGWLKLGNAKPEAFSPEFMSQLQVENQLDWYSYLFITEEPNIKSYLCEVPDIGKKKMLGLAMSQVGHPEVQLIIDPETYLVRGVQTEIPVAFKPTKYQILYGDHKEVVGAKLAHLIQGFHGGQAKFELKIKALRPVEEIDPNLFDSTKN